MPIQVLGEILSTLGGLLIAYAVLKVHHRVLREHKIDKRVVKIMKREQILGVLGAVLILVGGAMKVFGLLGI